MPPEAGLYREMVCTYRLREVFTGARILQAPEIMRKPEFAEHIQRRNSEACLKEQQQPMAEGQ